MRENRKGSDPDENLSMILNVFTYPVVSMILFILLNYWLNGVLP